MVALFVFFLLAIAVVVPISYTVEFKEAWQERVWEPPPPECIFKEFLDGLLIEAIEIERPRLEDLASSSDVIVRARLRSVAAGSERWHVDDPANGPDSDETGHIGALEYTFSVVEYLKGTGADEVVVVALAGPWIGRATIEEATLDAACALAMRDTRWDGREAILLLGHEDYRGFLVDFPQADRYYMGEAISDAHAYLWVVGPYAPPNFYATGWLPAASAALGASSSSDSARFLLGYPPRTKPLEWVFTNRPAPSFTLAQLKGAIAEVEREIADGG